MADGILDRLLTPKVVFGTLAVVIVVGALFAPEGEPVDAAGTLSSLSYEPSGMRGWYEGTSRMGWKAKRREERFHGELDARAVYVVVQPVIEPTASEVGTLLAAVRRGAGLIVSAPRGSAIADSLYMYADDFQYVGHPVVGGTLGEPRGAAENNAGARGGKPGAGVLDTIMPDDTGIVVHGATGSESDDDEDFGPHLESFDSAFARDDSVERARAGSDADSAARRVTRRRPVPPVLAAYTRHVHAALTTVRPLPRDTTAFLSVITMHHLTPSVRPAVLGLPKGAGRIVVLADAGILRNAILADEKLVVLPERLLEWAAPSVAAPVIFDEYHHGLGNHGSMLRAVRNAFINTPVGRAGMQILIALLVLLIALGARPIPARARMRLERRSPLEHVGALSRAYMQKGATRLAARRLVRGLRRRHGSAARSGDDEAFLHRLAERYPALTPGVKRLIAATKDPVSPRELTELADDIDTIERTLST